MLDVISSFPFFPLLSFYESSYLWINCTETNACTVPSFQSNNSILFLQLISTYILCGVDRQQILYTVVFILRGHYLKQSRRIFFEINAKNALNSSLGLFEVRETDASRNIVLVKYRFFVSFMEEVKQQFIKLFYASSEPRAIWNFAKLMDSA